MSVLLRCPSCGTTQGVPGECSACHEGQVRYYCDNHAPGLWLDSPECKTCGASYGDAPEPGARAPTAAPRPGTSRRRPAESSHPMPRPPSRKVPPTIRRPPAPGPEAEEPPTMPLPPSRLPTSLAGLLAHLIAAGRTRDSVRYERRGDPGELTHATRRPRGSGCLFKFLLIVAILLGLATCGPSLLLSLLNYGY